MSVVGPSQRDMQRLRAFTSKLSAYDATRPLLFCAPQPCPACKVGQVHPDNGGIVFPTGRMVGSVTCYRCGHRDLLTAGPPHHTFTGPRLHTPRKELH